MLAAVLLVLLGSLSAIDALDNGVGLTPPMGWLSWERFRCNTNCTADPKNCISEKLYMEMADRLVEDGYKDVGYEYVNIDDCWMARSRDANNKLYADPERFPSGIKGLADYMHKKGLKLGIYLDYGTKTCGGYPGSLDYLEIDAKTLAGWGVDMLKMDGCYADPKTMAKGYPEMTKYLNATGRPILFSCSWPVYTADSGLTNNYTLIAENCNIWRNYGDIQDSWQSVLSIIDYYAKKQDIYAPASGPGHFNDPDMLIIGDFSLSVEQAKAQMAMWAIFAAPLLMSNDLRTITQEYKDILLNKDVIAINQDKAGIMGKRVLQVDNVDIWTKSVGMYGSWGLAFFNRDTMNKTITVILKDIGLPYDRGYEVTDVLHHEHIGHREQTWPYNYTVPATGALLMYAFPSS